MSDEELGRWPRPQERERIASFLHALGECAIGMDDEVALYHAAECVQASLNRRRFDAPLPETKAMVLR